MKLKVYSDSNRWYEVVFYAVWDACTQRLAVGVSAGVKGTKIIGM
jgi:hypothetical protein